MKIQISLAVALQIAVQASSFPDLGTTDMLDHDAFKRQLFGENERDLTSAYGTNFFADSQNTYYDPYQMAWRFLGHMVKCGYPSDRYEQQSQHSHSNDNNNNFGNNYCQRYLMWAAYIDEDYSGGGIGEYYFYNEDESTDYTACNAHGNGRCAPMDCHDSSTETWKLMGIYKEAAWYGGDAFWEQLFKHEGVCVWNDDNIYEFMDESRSSWTAGCLQTGYTDEHGSSVYIDLKPGFNAYMRYALYVDEVCQEEYSGTKLNVDTVASSLGFLYGNYLSKWNKYLQPFTMCQPCKAYNLKLNYARKYGYNDDDGDGYDYSDDPNNGYFRCDDDAGYRNVNQCMKFRSHANLEVATWEDLVIGTEQGGILEIKVGETYFGSQRMSSSQASYLESVAQKRAQAAQQEEDEYQRLVSSIPSTKPAVAFGGIIMVMGSMALVFSFVWGIKQCKKSSSSTLREPLMTARKVGPNDRKAQQAGDQGPAGLVRDKYEPGQQQVVAIGSA